MIVKVWSRPVAPKNRLDAVAVLRGYNAESDTRREQLGDGRLDGVEQADTAEHHLVGPFGEQSRELLTPAFPSAGGELASVSASDTPISDRMRSAPAGGSPIS